MSRRVWVSLLAFLALPLVAGQTAPPLAVDGWSSLEAACGATVRLEATGDFPEAAVPRFGDARYDPGDAVLWDTDGSGDASPGDLLLSTTLGGVLDAPPPLPYAGDAGLASFAYVDDDADGVADVGEAVYLSADPKAVGVGDVRITGASGTQVRSTNADFGSPLASLPRPSWHDADGDSLVGPVDGVYLDADGNGFVTPADVRLGPVGTRAAGSRVLPGDSDENRSLAALPGRPALADPSAGVQVVDWQSSGTTLSLEATVDEDAAEGPRDLIIHHRDADPPWAILPGALDVRCPVADPSDLTVTSVEGVHRLDENTVLLLVVVANEGGTASPAVQGGVRATAGNATAPILAEADLPALEPGSSEGVRIRLPLAAGASGNLTIQIEADPRRVVPEADVSNNVHATVVPLVVPDDGETDGRENLNDVTTTRVERHRWVVVAGGAGGVAGVALGVAGLSYSVRFNRELQSQKSPGPRRGQKCRPGHMTQEPVEASLDLTGSSVQELYVRDPAGKPHDLGQDLVEAVQQALHNVPSDDVDDLVRNLAPDVHEAMKRVEAKAPLHLCLLLARAPVTLTKVLHICLPFGKDREVRLTSEGSALRQELGICGPTDPAGDDALTTVEQGLREVLRTARSFPFPVKLET